MVNNQFVKVLKQSRQFCDKGFGKPIWTPDMDGVHIIYEPSEQAFYALTFGPHTLCWTRLASGAGVLVFLSQDATDHPFRRAFPCQICGAVVKELLPVAKGWESPWLDAATRDMGSRVVLDICGETVPATAGYDPATVQNYIWGCLVRHDAVFPERFRVSAEQDFRVCADALRQVAAFVDGADPVKVTVYDARLCGRWERQHIDVRGDGYGIIVAVANENN